MKMLIGLCGLILALLPSGSAEAQKHPVDVFPHGSDCTEIKRLMPYSRSGVYMIHPTGSDIPFQVYCEMRSDGGWTVIQKRTGPAVSFDREWPSYESGFGHLTWDHWLGLKKIYWLTQSRRSILRVDLWDNERETAYAQYDNFRLGHSRTFYQLNVDRYTGNAGDAIRGTSPDKNQVGFGFSTSDRDNDGCKPCIFFLDVAVGRCTDYHGGGWWFSRCGSANLNGHYRGSGSQRSLRWGTWRGDNMIRATRMMIKSV